MSKQPSPIFADTYQVFTYIQHNLSETVFRGERQKFLPKSALDNVTKKDTIKLVASEDESLFLEEKDLDEFVEHVGRDGPRLFATCVRADLPMSCVLLLLNKGFTDADMPLSEDDCPGPRLRKRFVSSFVPNQSLFNTAYFDLDTIQILDNLTKPIAFDESKSLGKGAFGTVFTIEIHPEHRSFPSGNRKDEFAMKVTDYEGTRELPYHRAMASLSHVHLLKCLTSFIFSSKYHMIYEKADCNLEEFMAKHQNASGVRSLRAQDLAQQLSGIVGALSVIHNQSPPDEDANRLGIPQQESQKSGYIHDIKTDNLLLFKYIQDGKDIYWFRLSDFSCAKVVEFVATVSGLHRQSWQSTSKSGTPIYRAPESMTQGKTSRPYDLWSLGCVFLEVLVWFIEGYKALEDFREQRFRSVKPNGIEDHGFYYTDEVGPNPRVQLRQPVIQRISAITRRCDGHLQVIAKVIPQMLEIEPKKRITAEQLLKRLRIVGEAAPLPIQVASTRTFDLTPLKDSLSLPPTYVSDSDSDFGGVVKVQRPTDER
ncbi:kinase-like protein [Macroventuria anomochaeta]|uniref:Kinase-like protein n=1 Tax=Macroventuria anomochaeta TaxID=301207 RepID=A0ACB6RQC9_9PLEO|nr:kinase-like protein [Macroventuria anomochaeta]KAF2623989.1 kinase-like protein [Macroventuria anomochaeta]